ncbi:MAG TPA: hypothetical protein VGF46_02605 [Gaiellales bacterium]|jgi:hypothetical protein
MTLPELATYAGSQGWEPLGTPPLPDLSTRIATSIRNHYGQAGIQIHASGAAAASYRDAFGGPGFRVAHVWMAAGKLPASSLCALQIVRPLPAIAIDLRSDHSSLRDVPEVALGDVAFGARFEVRSHDPACVRELLVPAARAVLMRRDDWSLSFAGDQLLSVCFTPYRSVADIEERLAEMRSLVDAMPETSALATGSLVLDDGRDDRSEAARIEEALAALTLDRQSASGDDLERRRDELRTRRQR